MARHAVRGKLRVPDAMRCVAPLREAGTQPYFLKMGPGSTAHHLRAAQCPGHASLLVYLSSASYLASEETEPQREH